MCVKKHGKEAILSLNVRGLKANAMLKLPGLPVECRTVQDHFVKEIFLTFLDIKFRDAISECKMATFSNYFMFSQFSVIT